MPAKDLTHDLVKQALQAEGWIITHDPLYLQLEDTELYIDLAAEKIIAAEKAGKKIAVEVKSFAGVSPIAEFHTALGQFINYRVALAELYPDYELYLAVPANSYNSFFQRKLPRMVIQQYQLKMLIYQLDTAEIQTWIN